MIRAKELGGETLLVTLILGSLRWQGPIWAADGWKFAPYFERYLKRRKWEDERPAPTPRVVPRATDFAVRAEQEREERLLEERAERAFGK
jgi:hypothetical protein